MPAFATDTRPEPYAEILDAPACIRLGTALAVAALVIFALGRYSDIDLVLADLIYDRAAGAFPWREAWLTATFGHQILKAALMLLAAVFVVAAIADTVRPRVPGSPGRLPGRLQLRVIAWSAVLVPLATSLLKQSSNAHCPWDLARYGGSEPYARLFDALPAGSLPGHCLPAGHASSALWLVSLAVLWLPGPPRKAWRALGLSLAPGLAMGWMQQMRGAHFLTHTLWSAWIACAIVLLLVMLLQAREARGAHWGTASGGTGRRAPAGIRWRGR